MRCPICGVKGSKFTEYRGRKYARCPGCRGLERHRAVFSIFQQLELFTRFKPRTALLMVSMDRPYYAKLQKHFAVTVLTQEVEQADTMYGDICETPFRSGEFTVVVQVHTMEHVKDDRKATCEIHRLIRSGGIYISNVPCGGNETVEFGMADPDRDKHWRLYGFDDYLQLLCSCGFVRVRRIGTTFIAEKG
jgi:SAM-dependent methyltransferase